METIVIDKNGVYGNKKLLTIAFYKEGTERDSSAISLEHKFEEEESTYCRIELSLDELDQLADNIKQKVAVVRRDHAHS